MGEVFEVALLYGDVAGQSGCSGIQPCRINRFDVYVVAIDMVVELAFL